MRKYCLLFAVLACYTARGIAADNASRDVTPDSTSGVVTPTPEMWFYEQERARYDNTKGAVRRKAELRSAQRAGRLASSRWYGIYNQRPTASPSPWFGTYSPTWVSNTLDPFRWNAPTNTYVVQRAGNGNH